MTDIMHIPDYLADHADLRHYLCDQEKGGGGMAAHMVPLIPYVTCDNCLFLNLQNSEYTKANRLAVDYEQQLIQEAGAGAGETIAGDLFPLLSGDTIEFMELRDYITELLDKLEQGKQG